MNNISVLMSIYDKETPHNLDQCLESLANQTFPATEIIIVKDGILTDELDNLLDIWQKKMPIKIVGYEENKGLAYALNYGLQFCSYDLIARMDSDDICLNDRFEKQIKYFSEHKKTVILGSNIFEFYEDKKKYDLGEKRYPSIINKKTISLYKGSPIAHPTVVIKKEILEKYKYNIHVSSNEDIDLWFRLILDGYTIENINETLLKYRFTDKTFQRRNYRKSFNEFNIYWKYLIKLFGFSIMLIFPLFRFMFRLLPACCIKQIYIIRNKRWIKN